jgi:hypothetical protein
VSFSITERSACTRDEPREIIEKGVNPAFISPSTWGRSLMSHSFQSCRAKILRANEQIAHLRREIDAFMDEPPYGACRVVDDVDGQLSDYVRDVLVVFTKLVPESSS